MEQVELPVEAHDVVTIQDLEYLCKAVSDQRNVIDEISQKRKEEDKKLVELETKLIETLHNLGKTSYQSNIGTFYVSHRTSIKIPATPEDRQAFFGYLKEKGIFENMISVHSATLNAFYKEQLENAKETGEDFNIPGLGEPTISESVGFRKLK